MRKTFLVITLISTIGNIHAQECLNINFKLRGYFYAGTSESDSTSVGGFYADNNKPKKLNKKIIELTEPSTLQLIVKIDSIAEIEKGFQGFKVFLVNRTDSIAGLSAQDSRLYLKRQVFYRSKWEDVEYLPSSWCGNSYHKVFIKQDEYWDFTVPCLTGKEEANFRFVLTLSDNENIYSREFNGSFNKGQLKNEQGHNPINIMDPYDN